MLSEGIGLSSRETIKSLEDEKVYKYLGILKFASGKSKEMKDMITKEYYRGIRNILKASLNSGNIIQAINARAVSVFMYRAGMVEWRKNKLESIGRIARKLLTMRRNLQSRVDVERLY